MKCSLSLFPYREMLFPVKRSSTPNPVDCNMNRNHSISPSRALSVLSNVSQSSERFWNVNLWTVRYRFHILILILCIPSKFHQRFHQRLSLRCTNSVILNLLWFSAIAGSLKQQGAKRNIVKIDCEPVTFRKHPWQQNEFQPSYGGKKTFYVIFKLVAN